MNTFTEAEKLREEFYAEHLTENKTSIKSSPAEIADWWLSKLQAYKEYLIACGEGMKKEAPAENDIPFDWGVEFEGDRRERIGYNQALDAFITKIKGE